ncbi:MAG: universal stress protein [Chlamydiia bacterium]|nr:universal stress protein [Chlamydiia bacterium]
MYQTILVALDLVKTETCPVLKKARELQKLTGGKIHLIHVVEQFYTYDTPPYPFDLNEIQDQVIEAAEEKLGKVAEEFNVPESRRYVPVGSAKERILEAAQEIKADLIVVGSHSRQGISYLILGSTANGVLHGATCDVLAVRAQ